LIRGYATIGGFPANRNSAMDATHWSNNSRSMTWIFSLIN
jgi:hypothetical protein